MSRVVRTLLCLAIAIFCFAIALALAAGWINGSNGDAWLAGGLLATAVAAFAYVLPA